MSPLHGLSFAGQGSSVFVTCSGDIGQVDIWDRRTTEGGVLRGGGGGGGRRREGGVREEGRELTDPDQFQTRKLQGLKTDFMAGTNKVARTLKEPSYTEVVEPSRAIGKVGFALGVSGEAYPDSRVAVCGADWLALYETRNLGKPYVECRVAPSLSDMVLRNRFTQSQESLCIKV